MAKQRPGSKAVSITAIEEDVKAVRLMLPIPIHRALRVLAAQTDTNMSALARVAVEELLERSKGKHK
jgi:hypothetical protein